jgi:hypothetical protein
MCRHHLRAIPVWLSPVARKSVRLSDARLLRAAMFPDFPQTKPVSAKTGSPQLLW